MSVEESCWKTLKGVFQGKEEKVDSISSWSSTILLIWKRSLGDKNQWCFGFKMGIKIQSSFTGLLIPVKDKILLRR